MIENLDGYLLLSIEEDTSLSVEISGLDLDSSATGQVDDASAAVQVYGSLLSFGSTVAMTLAVVFVSM
jgi:hypothetical protein